MEEKIKLTKKDWAVLFELEKNARQSIQSIAKKTELSKQLVSYMVKKYENNKIILAYTAVIDSSRLGYSTYRVYLKLNNMNLEKDIDNFFNFLADLPETTIVNKLDGNWDAGFTISVKETYQFYEVWEKIMSYRKFIEEYKISIYSPIYHFTRKVIAPEGDKINVETRTLGCKEKADYIEEDIKILKLLTKNVRQSIVELSSKLKKSVPFIVKRIRWMEKIGIIQGYRPLFNWNLIGYSYFKIDLHLNSHERNNELFDYCKNHKNVIQVNQAIGGSDFEFEIYVKNIEEFKKIINELKEKFHKEIINYEYFGVEKPYKETFMAF